MTPPYEGVVYRPPSEADSLILQVTLGCSHNQCTYCGMYRDRSFRVKPLDEVFREIEEAAPRARGRTRRVFLADGDAMCLPAGHLEKLLDKLAAELPELARVGIYATANDINAKTPAELRRLRDKKLAILYLGLESGDDETLRRIKKGAPSADWIAAAGKAREAGMKLSVIALLGIAGPGEASRRHAAATGRVVSAMAPRFFSCLTLTPVPRTAIGKAYERGEFSLIPPTESLREMRLIVENLELSGTVFRSNHASNYLPIAGNLPRDKDAILAAIDAALRGEIALKPEFLRGL